MSNRAISVLMVAALCGVGCSQDPKVVKQKHLESGNKYFQNGRYKEAAIMYRRALTKDKMYGEAYYRLALAEMKLNDLPGAVRDLYRSSQLQPDNADATTKLIDIYLAAYAANPGEGKNVRTELEGLEDKLLKKDPNSYDGLRVKGYLALMKSDYPEAQAAFEKARQLQPDKPEVVVALSQVFSAQKQWEAADKLAEAYLARHKDTLQLYNVLYMNAMANGQPQKAEAVLKDKQRNNPKVATTYSDLAAYYYQAKDPAAIDAVLKEMTDRPKGSLEFPSENPSAYLLAGGFYQAHGNSDKAVAAYRQGLSADPEHKLLYEAKLGQLLLLGPKPEDARPLVDDILKADSNNVDGLTMKAGLLLLSKKKEDAEAAVADLRKVVREKPDNATFRLNLGRALFAAGHPDEALNEFGEAIKLDPGPNMLAARFSVAQISESRRPDPDFGRADQAATEILQLDPNSIPARLIRANAAFYLKRHDQAREDLNLVLRAIPGQQDAMFQLGRLNLAEGGAAMQEHDRQVTKGDRLAAARAEQVAATHYHDADVLFRRLQEVKDSRGFSGLVEAQAGLGHPEKAIELLKQDLSANPDKVEDYLSLGNLYSARKDNDAALTAYQEVVKRRPQSSEAMIRVGTTYTAKGDYGSAEKTLLKAVQLSPAKDVNALLALANVYELSNQRGKAKPLYEKVLSLQSDNPVALNNLAYILAEKDNDLDAALTYAQRARQKWPENIEISDTLGWIYLRKRLPDNAMPLLQDIVKQEPSRASFRLHMAEALYQKQQKDQARRELDAAAHDNPSKDEQQKIEELRAKVG